MAEVLVLPGIERRDLIGEPTPAEQVLNASIEKGVTDVVVIGRHRDGSQYVASSLNDVDKSVGVLMSAVHFLTSGTFDQGIQEICENPPEGA